MTGKRSPRRGLAFGLAGAVAIVCGAGARLLGTCGPFTDVAADGFCPFVLEIFTLGITTGTSPTTYDPGGNVTRIQMAAFLSRSVDSTLKRRNQRAPLSQFWTVQAPSFLSVVTVGSSPTRVQSDGTDLWVARTAAGTIMRVRASDGGILESWTGATLASGMLVAGNRVLVAGFTNPGVLYRIDPNLPPGAVTTVASNLGIDPSGIAFDGARFFTANFGTSVGSVSIVTPTAAIPWTVTTVTIGTGATRPVDALFDGANVWVTDGGANTLVKLDSAANVLQTVTVGVAPREPVFDGSNIWVPNNTEDSVTVVRASNGAVLQTITGNGLNSPVGSAFDGERVLFTNFVGNTVSLFKAADLSPLGTIPMGAGVIPNRACSDGLGFWVTLTGATGVVGRF